MNTFPISHFNGARDADELVVYTGTGRTKTNCYGLEAVVENGRVTVFGSNDHEIPENGFVVSGHGKGAAIVQTSFIEGAKVVLDENAMTISVEIDSMALKLSADQKVAMIEERIALLEQKREAFEKEKALTYLAELRKAIDEERFSDVDAPFEMAYYLTASTKKGEVRAVWHRPSEHSYEEVEAMVKRFRAAGFNQILVETDYEGYSNALAIHHDYLPVRKGWEDGFDVIGAFVQAGKKLGVEIHAWFEDFFYGVKGWGCPIGELHPEWLAKRKDGGLLHDAYNDFYFLNPALPEVRELLLNHIRDLLDHYDFDGFQLDYIRYPVGNGVDRTAGFDDYSKKTFLAETGIDIDTVTDDRSEEWKRFTEWRAEFVTLYVKQVYDLIQEYRRNGRVIKLSTAVFGDPQEAIRLKAQDWRRWVTEGWLDAIYPMAYLADAKDVGNEVGYMVKNYGQASNISGIAPMYSHLPAIESTKQVEECRNAGATGIAFFCADNCTDEQLSYLRCGVFRED